MLQWKGGGGARAGGIGARATTPPGHRANQGGLNLHGRVSLKGNWLQFSIRAAPETIAPVSSDGERIFLDRHRLAPRLLGLLRLVLLRLALPQLGWRRLAPWWLTPRWILPGMVAGMLWAAMFSPAPAPAQSTSAQSISTPNTTTNFTEMKAMLEGFGFKVLEEKGGLVVEVTLQETLRLVLERNISLESLRVGEAIALSDLEAARNQDHPTLTNSADYSRGLSPVLSTFDGSGLTLAGSDAFSLSSVYSQTLGNGIEYSLTLSESRSRYDSSTIAALGGNPENQPAGEWLETTSLKGAVTIPIFQDFGQALHGIPVRRSEVGVGESRMDIRGQELGLLEIAASTYWDLVAAIENVKVQQDAVKLSGQLLKDNQQRLLTGVLSPFDVQVTETQLAREREGLLTARSEVARIEDLARAILNLEVAGLSIRPLEVPRLRDEAFPYREMLEKMYRSSPALRQLQMSLERNDLDLLEARNGDEPDLDLELYYQMIGYGDSPLEGAGGFSQTDVGGYGATLTWTVPLFDVETRENIRKRTLERKRVELDIASLKSDLNVRLQGVLRQLRLNREQVETARIASRLAEEQLKNEIVRIQVGESTSFQVAQFQQDASSARVREILARLRYERSYLSLLVLTGDIYENFDLKAAF